MARRRTTNVISLPEAIAGWLASIGSKPGRSPRTMRAYRNGSAVFLRWMTDQGYPTADVSRIDRDMVTAYRDHTIAAYAPATARLYYWIVRGVWTYLTNDLELVDADGYDLDNMKRVKAPRYKRKAPPVMEAADLGEMLKATKGDFRDNAILQVLLSSGLRRAELAALRLHDIDLDAIPATVNVTSGKGDKDRTTVIDGDAVVAVRKYLLHGRKGIYRSLDALFLGRAGAMSPDAVGDVVVRVAGDAEVKLVAKDGSVRDVTAHALRHWWVSNLRRCEMSDDAIRHLGGWSAPESDNSAFYGSAKGAERALAEYQRKWRRPNM